MGIVILTYSHCHGIATQRKRQRRQSNISFQGRRLTMLKSCEIVATSLFQIEHIFEYWICYFLFSLSMIHISKFIFLQISLDCHLNICSNSHGIFDLTYSHSHDNCHKITVTFMGIISLNFPNIWSVTSTYSYSNGNCHLNLQSLSLDCHTENKTEEAIQHIIPRKKTYNAQQLWNCCYFFTPQLFSKL